MTLSFFDGNRDSDWIEIREDRFFSFLNPASQNNFLQSLLSGFYSARLWKEQKRARAASLSLKQSQISCIIWSQRVTPPLDKKSRLATHSAKNNACLYLWTILSCCVDVDYFSGMFFSNYYPMSCIQKSRILLVLFQSRKKFRGHFETN